MKSKGHNNRVGKVQDKIRSFVILDIISEHLQTLSETVWRFMLDGK